MDSRTYYYARVSSKEQNLDRQIAAFKALGAQEREIITDKESGKDLNRAGYAALKNAMLRRGDTLVVKSLDRLSRNKCDIKNELQYFKDNGIRLKVIDLPTTMMELPEGQEWVFEMVNNILIEVLGTIAEQERTTIKQRQAEGIAAAKQNGKRLQSRSAKPSVSGKRRALKQQSKMARNWGVPHLSFLRTGTASTLLGKPGKSLQKQLWSKRVQSGQVFTN